MKENKIYQITVTELLARDISIKAENSTEAERILDERIQKEEIVLDDGDFIERNFTAENENFFYLTEQTLPKKLSGEKEHLFSVIEVLQKKVDISASGENEAKAIAEEMVRRCELVLSGDDYLDRIIRKYPKAELETIEKGKEVILYDNNDVTERLLSLFPEGVEINLAKESIAHLVKMEQCESQNEEEREFDGLLDDFNNDLLVQYGELKASLALLPKDYSQIFADSHTYYSNMLGNRGYPSDVNAATVMLNGNEDMKGVRVRVPLRTDMLDNLQIENVPYREVMEIIKGMDIRKGEEKRLSSILSIHKAKPLYKRIENVRFYPSSDGKINIRCFLDGKATLGCKMTEKDKEEMLGGKDKILLAAKYFESELTNNRERVVSHKR